MLWAKAQQVAKKALADGNLKPIITTSSLVVQDGIRFLLYTVDDADDKTIKRPVKGLVNPFLPYQQELLVAELDPSYVCLLNKFPVLLPHLLICSRAFVEQSAVLTLADFNAWLHGFKPQTAVEQQRAGQSPEVLGFYNSGPIAGASQRHRHIQLVQTPIPLADIIINGQLPFNHYLIKYQQLSARHLFNHYRQAMQQLGLSPTDGCKAYNILLTKHWMLIVARSAGNISNVSANGLNYAGLFLVKNEQQAQWLMDYGLLNFLSHCSQGEPNH